MPGAIVVVGAVSVVVGGVSVVVVVIVGGVVPPDLGRYLMPVAGQSPFEPSE